MNERAHIAENAVGLASLPADDAERVGAFAHARECAACARALQQAERLLLALDAPPPLPPRATVLGAIARPILARLSALAVPTRLLAAVMVTLWLILVFTAKHRAGGDPAWIESIALAAVALSCLALLRRVGALAAGLAFGASALLVAIGWDDGPFAPHKGVACLLTVLGAATLPTALAARAFIRRRSTSPTLGLVVAAASGALIGQAALLLTCPNRPAGLHVLVFHCGGVALAAAIGGLIGRMIARPLPQPT